MRVCCRRVSILGLPAIMNIWEEKFYTPPLYMYQRAARGRRPCATDAPAEESRCRIILMIMINITPPGSDF